jgi:type IV secretory pathway VirB10-like protein
MEGETGSTDRVRDGEAGPARNFVGLWPLGVIVLLLGFIACQGYDRDRSDGTSSAQPMLDTLPSPTPQSPLPISVTGEFKDALGAAAQTPPATPQPTPNPATTDTNQTQTSVEQPRPQPMQQSRTQRASLPETLRQQQEQQLRHQEELAERERELYWKTEAQKVRAQLHAVAARYKSQVCQEIMGGIPVSTARDNSGDYVAARAAAQAFEESARREGVPPGWARTNFTDYPERVDPSTGYHPRDVARNWGCPEWE